MCQQYRAAYVLLVLVILAMISLVLSPFARADVTALHLTWVDNATNEDGYRVQRKDGSGEWIQVVELPANASTWDDSTWQANTQYTYRVYAYNKFGNSGFSNEAGISTAVPGPPGGLTVTVNVTVSIVK